MEEHIMNKDILDFVTFCVGAVALSLNMPRTVVFARLKKANLIYDYIVPGYDVLHTFSRQYIVEDITDMMKRKGVLA
ncbi:DUF3791 domain-containing protein [Parabacteroides distasonis]|uniref:DUF3791 domain-containing protein n=2 Tax=Parabacteroides distasonis TaxID=823 RepID=UPI00321985F3